jgi:hypothetical protein
MSEACKLHMTEICTRFWLESLKGRDQLEHTSTDGRIILKWISRKLGEKLFTGFIWLRIGTSGRLVNMV